MPSTPPVKDHSIPNRKLLSRRRRSRASIGLDPLPSIVSPVSVDEVTIDYNASAELEVIDGAITNEKLADADTEYANGVTVKGWNADDEAWEEQRAIGGSGTTLQLAIWTTDGDIGPARSYEDPDEGAAVLIVPGLTSDTVGAIYAGSTASGYTVDGVTGESDSGDGVVGKSNTGAGGRFENTGTSGSAVVAENTNGANTDAAIDCIGGLKMSGFEALGNRIVTPTALAPNITGAVTDRLVRFSTIDVTVGSKYFLPPAGAVPAGWCVTVSDESGLSGTRSLWVERSGLDTIAGAVNVLFGASAVGDNARLTLYSDGVSAWYRI
jgi:hypothetical protein